MHPNHITPATLHWCNPRTPLSITYADPYFSVDDGLAESRYVFLEGIHFNQLLQQQRYITIGELGFGTGLNFIATWQAFQQHATPTQRLHFVSIEKHPFTQADLQSIARHWPELSAYYDSLLAAYPLLIPGCQRLFFEQGRVTLDLWFGDAAAVLPELVPNTIHAWYLDGFAPAKNPAMWQHDILQHVANLATPGAQLATFTVAGAVRRGLTAAGFTVNKRVGFRYKRHCLTAYKSGTLPAPKPNSVTIYGAGIAGSALTHALTQKGVTVQLHDKTHTIAAQTVPYALFNPKLTVDQSPLGCMHRAAYLFALRLYNYLPQSPWQGQRGILTIAYNKQRQIRYDKIAANNMLGEQHVTRLSASQASQLAHHPIHNTCLHLPQAGVLSTQMICQQLAQAGQFSQRMFQNNTIDQTTVLCLGPWMKPLYPQLPIHLNRGQIHFSQPTATVPEYTLIGPGYLTCALKSNMCLGGATYRRDIDLASAWQEPTAADKQEITEKIMQIYPQAHLLSDRAWVGIRATTQTRLPLFGQLANNLFFLTGLGSHGFVLAPLAAEILTSQLLQLPLPLERSLFNC